MWNPFKGPSLGEETLCTKQGPGGGAVGHGQGTDHVKSKSATSSSEARGFVGHRSLLRQETAG